MLRLLGAIFLTFLIIGLNRAFSFPQDDLSLGKSERLSTRQKIELVYRNAKFQAPADPTFESSRAEILTLVNHDPFLSKKDKQWVKEKLKDLQSTLRSPIAMEEPLP